MRVVSLGMYDFPELRAATEAWWRAVARGLTRRGVVDVPQRPDATLPPDAALRSPHLLFGQTCGYPFTHALAGVVELVAVPVWRIAGLEPGTYDSVVVVREGDPASGFADLRGRPVAINGLDSQSGCNVLRALAAPVQADGRFFGAVAITGAHLASLDAVRAGAADCAAIDVVTWTLVMRHRPERVRGLRVLAHGPAAPALPYVTAAGTPREVRAALLEALAEAMADPRLEAAREALLLAGIATPDPAVYAAIPAMREAAERLGFRQF